MGIRSHLDCISPVQRCSSYTHMARALHVSGLVTTLFHRSKKTPTGEQGRVNVDVLAHLQATVTVVTAFKRGG